MRASRNDRRALETANPEPSRDGGGAALDRPARAPGALPDGRWSLYARIARELGPYSRHLAAVFLLSLISAPLALMLPLPLKIAVDSVLQTHPIPGFLDACLPESIGRSPEAILLVAVALAVLVALLAEARSLASSWLAAYTGEKILRHFRARLFRHVQRLSLSYHDTKGTADSLYRIQYDAVSLQRIAVDGIVPFVSSALTFASMLWVTIQISWQLALVAVSISPAILVLSRVYRTRFRPQAREIRKVESSALSVVQEALGAARVVKAFGQERRELKRFTEKSTEGTRARLRLEATKGGFALLVTLVTAIGGAAVLLVGVRGVQSGALSLGSLLLVMAYVAQLHAPLKTIGRKASSMHSNLAGVERAFALLDESPDVLERAGARPIARARGAMAFQGVRFAYDRARPVLTDVSFEIGPGTCLGIVGATGAGKTTLVSLLTRFYDPQAGRILLDGVDLRDYKVADLRRQFALVLQEPVLFSSTIGENIAYARPEASRTEVVEAAKAAGAHDFILRLPEGYDTVVGERGMLLSGGERQRISLARAFLKDAPILVLDEPTSSVDVVTESAIVEAMERLRAGRTTFLITHRASALKPCDLILRIEEGRVSGPGLAPAGAVVPRPPARAAQAGRGQAHV